MKREELEKLIELLERIICEFQKLQQGNIEFLKDLNSIPASKRHKSDDVIREEVEKTVKQFDDFIQKKNAEIAYYKGMLAGKMFED